MNDVFFLAARPGIPWYAYFSKGLQEWGFSCHAWLIEAEDVPIAEATGAFASVEHLTEGFDRRNIGDVGRQLELGRELEGRVGGAFLHREAAADRVLTGTQFFELPPPQVRGRWQWPQLVALAVHACRNVDILLDKSDPVAIVGEVSYFMPRVIAALAASRSVPTLMPTGVFIGERRMSFLNGIDGQWDECIALYRSYLHSGAIPQDHAKAAWAQMESIRFGRRPVLTAATPRDHFPSLGDRFGWHRIANLLELAMETRNPSHHSSIRYQNSTLVDPYFRARRKLRRYRVRRIYEKIAARSLPEIPFVSYFLHVQPEVTVEGWSFHYQDQIALIRNIAASLPANIALVVKEHGSQPGRDLSFYKEIMSIPGVAFVHHSVPNVIEGSLAVLTLVGTVTGEAMCLGKPVIMFGSVYYEHFAGVTKANSLEHLQGLLADIENLPVPSEEVIQAAFAARHAASYTEPWAWTELASGDYSLGEATLRALGERLTRIREAIVKSEKDKGHQAFPWVAG